MNTVLKAAQEGVQLGWVLGVMTVVFLVIFMAWVVWAYHPRNKSLMEEAARMPFMDGGEG
jgi:hypothetical protein